MVTVSSRQEAKIYIFPTRDRDASRRRDAALVTAAAATRIYEVVGPGAWYHEAAIKEERGRKD